MCVCVQYEKNPANGFREVIQKKYPLTLLRGRRILIPVFPHEVHILPGVLKKKVLF